MTQLTPVTPAIEFAFLGSISHATMREADLIPAFLDVLSQLDFDRYTAICEEYNTDQIDYDTEDTEEIETIGYLLNEVLFDALNDYAPSGYYFGAHPGDGSDYGFWLNDEDYNVLATTHFESYL